MSHKNQLTINWQSCALTLAMGVAGNTALSLLVYASQLTPFAL